MDSYHISYTIWYYPNKIGGNPDDMMVNVLDCDIVVSEFMHQSLYYIHFQIHTLRESMNPFIPPAMLFYKDWFGIK